ncbi:monooxygenase [Halteromyces radiatus]|uniref:monooxygenase n=1 Tax=Halteromyces radiatus TaxID=101107 RepID=UPI00221EE2E1|nr:monooxygenase [Halteromyces radiatus]KAI8076883.1 monooxygenase [Halteromyces radiatus]
MSSSLSVAIIGSGFSGIAAAVQVQKQLGIKATIFESSDDIGGTWKHNFYPGCACDVPSHLYSLSFAPNPDWSHRFSPQAEILEYMRGVAKQFNLYDQTIFNTEVVRANWIQERKQWELSLREVGSSNVQISYFDVVFAGLGPLRIPRYPEEFKSFEGKIIHTAFWDNSVDLTDKRVAVIGSGASAVQLIPKIQPIVSQLTSYQRNPTWCLVRGQYKYSRLTKFLFRWVPFLMKFYRYTIFLGLELFYLNFRLFNTFVGRAIRKAAINEMTKRLTDKGRPDLVEKLIPDYELGCLRITPSETYLEALAEKNVVVERSGIASVQGRTITTKDGNEFECDVLILATGYDAQGYLGNLEVNGRDGKNLNKLWEENYTATYKSIAIHGFPNFFMLLGPASLLGHNSVVAMAEIQIDAAIRGLKQLGKDVKAIEPTEKAQNDFVSQLKNTLGKTVWATKCNSWYKDSRGEIFSLWSSTVTSFYWTLRNSNFKDDFIQYK